MLKIYLPYLFGNKKNQNYKLPKAIPWGSLSLEGKLTLKYLNNQLEDFLQNELIYDSITKQDAFHLFNFLDFILNQNFKNKLLVKYSSEFQLYSEISKTRCTLTENQLNEVLNFEVNQNTLYAILPSDRKLTGRFILKNKNNEWERDSVGNIWSLPVLGMSSRGLAFHHSNGETPQGVYKIEGVMPKADQFEKFGKYHRLILNFCSSVQNEEESKNHLPNSHHNLLWWKEAILARELGRSHLRIHGAGKINKNIFATYFPFIPTSGCLAVRENLIFNDQKKLLEKLMNVQEVFDLQEIKMNLIVLNVDEFKENLIDIV